MPAPSQRGSRSATARCGSADAIGAELLRVDPASGESQAVPLAGQPSGVAFTPERCLGLGRTGRGRARRPRGPERDAHPERGERTDGGALRVRLDLGREPPRRHRLPPRALHRSRGGDDPGGGRPGRARGRGGLAVGRERVRRLDHRDRPGHEHPRAGRSGGWRGGVPRGRWRRAVVGRRGIGHRAPRRDPDRLLRRRGARRRWTPPSSRTTTGSAGRSSRSRTTGSCRTGRWEARTAPRSSRTWRRRSPRCPKTG